MHPANSAVMIDGRALWAQCRRFMLIISFKRRLQLRRQYIGVHGSSHVSKSPISIFHVNNVGRSFNLLITGFITLCVQKLSSISLEDQWYSRIALEHTEQDFTATCQL